ncbi:hypothetical protein WMY93_028198 [Mugilogobius chulae]|uniref:Uncharacterized protein n=1 Tax=Mugilogobius chulae TaxID=88201 RepID=A0AAW0MYM5_9GOBI
MTKTPQSTSSSCLVCINGRPRRQYAPQIRLNAQDTDLTLRMEAKTPRRCPVTLALGPPLLLLSLSPFTPSYGNMCVLSIRAACVPVQSGASVCGLSNQQSECVCSCQSGGVLCLSQERVCVLLSNQERVCVLLSIRGVCVLLSNQEVMCVLRPIRSDVCSCPIKASVLLLSIRRVCVLRSGSWSVPDRAVRRSMFSRLQLNSSSDTSPVGQFCWARGVEVVVADFQKSLLSLLDFKVVNE